MTNLGLNLASSESSFHRRALKFPPSHFSTPLSLPRHPTAWAEALQTPLSLNQHLSFNDKWEFCLEEGRWQHWRWHFGGDIPEVPSWQELCATSLWQGWPWEAQAVPFTNIPVFPVAVVL